MSEEEIAKELSQTSTLSITSKVMEIRIEKKYNLTLKEFKDKWPEYFL